MTERFLSSAETAKRLGLTPKALRLYETRGLLTPVRNEVGWRSYGPTEVAFKQLGLSLSDIAAILKSGADTLNTVLALQERALLRENEHISRALILVQAAREKLAQGAPLSITDLTGLALETAPLTPLWEKHFTRVELDEIAGRADDEVRWQRLLAEFEKLPDKENPSSPEAVNLGRRWLEQADRYLRGDRKLLKKMQAFSVDAMSDPEMRKALPLTPEQYHFLTKIIGQLKAEA
jgi:DNA-binding transcriptional MerR regulator